MKYYWINTQKKSILIGELKEDWCFLFAGHDRKWMSFEDWLDTFRYEKGTIEDEDNTSIHVEEFKDIVRKSYGGRNLRSVRDRIDEKGYRFWDEPFK